jgi:uncharacterized repeat protein (TIGR01451 family)
LAFLLDDEEMSYYIVNEPLMPVSMLKHLSFFCCLLTITISSSSQAPGIKFSRYVNTSTDGEIYYDIKATPDKGFIAVGTDSISNYNKGRIGNKYISALGTVTKLDSLGNPIWRRDNRANAMRSALTSVVLTDGGYAAAGYKRISTGDSSSLYLVKYSTSGNLIWEKTYGGTSDDVMQSIARTITGGYILAGYTTSTNSYVTGNHGGSDVWLTKHDSLGVFMWGRCFGGSGADTAYSVIETADRGYVVAGVSRSTDGNLTANGGASDGWIFKTDSSGSLQWQKNLGGVGNDGFKSVVANADGSYKVTGYTYSPTATSNGNKGRSDVWVVRISGDGNTVLWSKGFGGTIDEFGFSLIKTQDDGYLVTGATESTANDVSGNNGLYDAWLLKITADGSLAWQRCMGSNKDEFGMTVAYISENNFMVAGFGDPQVVAPPDLTDAYLVRLGNSNIIKGMVYFDMNGDLVKQASEPGFSQAQVRTVKTGFERSAIPVNGLFRIDVESGIYTTGLVLNSPYFTVVPASRISNFPGFFATDSLVFAVQANPNFQDLAIQAIATGVARPGFPVTYKIYYKNRGTVPIVNAQVLFNRDSRLNFGSSVPAVSSISGDTLKWNIPSLNVLDSGSITINLTVGAPPIVNNGNVLTSLAHINPVSGDETPGDNLAILRQVAQGSYDPNDKAENFGGSITPEQVTAEEYINYVIRFQNTGTDTAFTVVVRDTLDAQLNWNSLEMVSTSHSNLMQIISQNMLSWTFNNINLPDSNVNEPLSHGFIVYRIKPNTTLSVGDIIPNGASIYFDFNLPVATNLVQTEVASMISLPVNLLDFTTVYKKPHAVLDWSSAGEHNFQQFEIERGTDPFHFSLAGIVPAGNVGSGSYHYTDDLSAVSGNKFYYRLKMVDIDGRFSYSSVRMLARDGSELYALTVNPNPARTNTALAHINWNSAELVGVSIIDMQGKTIRSLQRNMPKGFTILPVDLAGIQRGTYLLQIRGRSKTLTSKFIIAN